MLFWTVKYCKSKFKISWVKCLFCSSEFLRFRMVSSISGYKRQSRGQLRRTETSNRRSSKPFNRSINKRFTVGHPVPQDPRITQISAPRSTFPFLRVKPSPCTALALGIAHPARLGFHPWTDPAVSISLSLSWGLQKFLAAAPPQPRRAGLLIKSCAVILSVHCTQFCQVSGVLELTRNSRFCTGWTSQERSAF